MDGVAAAKGTPHSLVLKLVPGEKPLGFNGWGSYSNVNAGKHNVKEQSKHTTMLYSGDRSILLRLYLGLPGFEALGRMVRDACDDMEIAFVHVLQQSSAQACFSWHKDTDTQGYERVRKTLVVMLSESRSSMQVMHEPIFVYEGAGSAALFDSDLVHRSGEASPGTIKIAVMLKKKKKRARGH